MHRHKYIAQDVEDQLMLAVDLLMDIEPGWDDEDDEIAVGAGQDDDENKSRKTGKSGASRQSKVSKAMTKKSRTKQSVAGKTTKSKLSKASMRSKSMKSGQSRGSKKTTTSLSKRSEEDANPTFMNCAHFDKLIRIHSMLAMLAPDANKQREYALDGHFFIMKMWEQSFMALNATAFFEAHSAEIAELGYRVNDAASRREYFAEVLTSGELQVPVKYHLPEKPEDWAKFDLPEEFGEKATKHEDKVMIGKWTFMKPELTYYHIKNICQMLEN